MLNLKPGSVKFLEIWNHYSREGSGKMVLAVSGKKTPDENPVKLIIFNF